MRLWNYVHTQLAPVFGVELHVWEFLALILAIAIILIAVAHGICQKRREKKYEQSLDAMADTSNPWAMDNTGESEAGEKEEKAI